MKPSKEPNKNKNEKKKIPNYAKENLESIKISDGIKDKFGLDKKGKPPWLLIIGIIAVVVLLAQFAIGGPLQKIKQLNEKNAEEQQEVVEEKEDLPSNTNKIKTTQTIKKEITNANMEIKVLDTKGECIIISSGDEVCLVNTGNQYDTDEIENELKKINPRVVNIVFTEWNENTTGSVIDLMENQNVSYIYVNSIELYDDIAELVFTRAEQKNVIVKEASQDSSERLGNGTMRVFGSNKENSQNNNMHLVVQFIDNEISTLISIDNSIEELKNVFSYTKMNNTNQVSTVCYLSMCSASDSDFYELVPDLASDTFIVKADEQQQDTMMQKIVERGYKTINASTMGTFSIKTNGTDFNILSNE